MKLILKFFLASNLDKLIQVAFEDGSTTSYALLNAQERGLLFVQPGQDVYKGQIVGIHQRPGDLAINVCKKKAATNVRSNKETTGKTFFLLSTQQLSDFHFLFLPDLPLLCNKFMYCELSLLIKRSDSCCDINGKIFEKEQRYQYIVMYSCIEDSVGGSS